MRGITVQAYTVDRAISVEQKSLTFPVHLCVTQHIGIAARRIEI